MQNLWNDETARECTTPLAMRAWTSRLLGRDRDLVLYGGGNTSWKTTDTLYVKSTGSDLSTVSESDFTALHLAALRSLLDDPALDNAAVMRSIEGCKLDANAPKPSIETLLHAVIPKPWIEHAHADAILAVANVESCVETCAEVFGELAPVVPYRHSGAALARACKAVYETLATENTIGLILAFHGVVAFGRDARESYGNLLRLVNLAESWLKNRGAWQLPEDHVAANAASAEALRERISAVAGFPLSVLIDRSPLAMAWARRPDLAEVATQGPPTPQHAIYTKRLPLIGDDVEGYTSRYRLILERELGAEARLVDATPRIALDPGLGICILGVNPHYAAVAAEIYQHGMAIMTRAAAHGRYRAASLSDISLAELEYGGFERRVLSKLTP
ncbi:MAG: class II aldolase/adducin family protein [Burkholderiales bacterium]|nr:class II aldolase/adducin family protein [Burkholderiales bacterium]